MKIPSLVGRNIKVAARAVQPKQRAAAQRVRVKVRVSEELRALIVKGARQLGLTISEFVELAIRAKLPLIEAASKSQVKGGAK